MDEPLDAALSHKQLVLYAQDLSATYQELKKENARLQQALARSEELVRERDAAYGELQLAASQARQQEKLAVIGLLAAGIIHEINSPTAFIASNLATLARYLEKLENFVCIQSAALAEAGGEEQAALVREARGTLKIDLVLGDAPQLLLDCRDGAERIGNIVKELKRFAHPEQQASEPVDLNDCLEKSLNLVWHELKYKVRITKEYGVLPLVSGRPQRLTQVFMNLLLNAAQAQAPEQQGEITLRTWARDNGVYVAVADTGCGIGGEHLDHIFKPFFTTKEVGQGTGLGLSIVHDIVREHGGEISVASEIGKGATFTVKLPVG